MDKEILGRLRKVDNATYELSKSYKQGMRVPVRIIASEKLLREMDNAVVEQASNVATLPGIVGYSLAMPDAHWGYGFCLTPDTKVLSDLGFYMKIKDFENWRNQKVKCFDLKLKKQEESSIERFIKLKARKVFRIITKHGNEIKATEDHPFLTPKGMKEVEKLKEGDKIAIFPFEGIAYEKPSQEVIISEADIKKVMLKLGKKPGKPCFDQNLKALKKRKLLPLTYEHEKLPYLLRIMGFVFGDGSMNFIGKKKDGIISFFGKKNDLEEIRKDIARLGYTPSPIHKRKTRLVYKGKEKTYIGYSFYVNATSLLILLHTLGMPIGEKVSQAYRVPKWIFKCKLWQKRLFLASFFGAELRMPNPRKTKRTMFNAPVLSMIKAEDLILNGKEFLQDIAKLLKEFGVETLYINQRKKHESKKGQVTWHLGLVFSSKTKSLINLYSKMGFEYNQESSCMANIVAGYLKYKEKILEEKKEAIKKVVELLKRGLSYRKIAMQLASHNPITKRFIEDVCWKINKGRKNIKPLVPKTFPSFKSYLNKATKGLGKSGMVWDEIAGIEELPYDDFVYDFTLAKYHNFIANNFVVSNCIGGVAAFDADNGGVISPGGIGFDINCGMRLVRTDLSTKDVKPKIKELVNALFERVPAGVGSKGLLRLNKQEFKHVCEQGAKWIVEKGFGWPEDLEVTEENGCMENADASKVSEKAISRGIDQVGTLGSGNHYLELQWVKPENIADKRLAKKWGLFEDQVVIMFHCGSRGFGHQVATDYLKIFLDVMESKYGIKILDKELAAAPFYSKEGQDYFSAMKCAMNMSWANRQVILHRIREVFERVFKQDAEKLGIRQVYDVAHNSAKLEQQEWKGKKLNLLVHRKGATRAFIAGMQGLPSRYAEDGQPVIIGGSMETGSYLLVASPGAKKTFFSTAHGSGRTMSRHKAKKLVRGEKLVKELEKRGIYVKAVSYAGVAEEAGIAYKNIDDVVKSTEQAGISKAVVKLIPIGNIKG